MLNSVSVKTVHNLHAVPLLQYDQIYDLCHVRCPWSIIYDVTCQTIHRSAHSFYNEWYFTNSLNHWPQKTSIETTWEQLVIVTSQFLAAGLFIIDITIGKQLFLKSSGVMTRWNVDLRQLSYRNHKNDPCTKCTESEIPGSCCSRSARHLGFGRDNGYFSQSYIRFVYILIASFIHHNVTSS